MENTLIINLWNTKPLVASTRKGKNDDGKQ